MMDMKDRLKWQRIVKDALELRNIIFTFEELLSHTKSVCEAVDEIEQEMREELETAMIAKIHQFIEAERAK